MALYTLFRNKKGISIILFALMAPLLLGLTGLVSDVGLLYARKAHLQNAADAAATAGALDLWLDAVDQDPKTSTTTARTYLQTNGVSAANAASAAITYPAADLIRVSVTEEVPLFFMQYFGFPATTPVVAVATARGIANSDAIFARRFVDNGGATISGNIYTQQDLVGHGGLMVRGKAEATGTVDFTGGSTATGGTASGVPLRQMPTIDLTHKTDLMPAILPVPAKKTNTIVIPPGDYTSYGVVYLNYPNTTFEFSGTVTGAFYTDLTSDIQIDNNTVFTGLFYSTQGNIRSLGDQSVLKGAIVCGGTVTLDGGFTFDKTGTKYVTYPDATMTNTSRLVPNDTTQ